MKLRYKTIPVFELSLDEMRESLNQQGGFCPFEYDLGVYAEMDTEKIGEMANIMRLLGRGCLPPSEKAAIAKTLDDQKLNPAERKAKERAVQRLRDLLLR